MGAPVINTKTFDYREPPKAQFDTAQLISSFNFVSLCTQKILHQG